MTGTDRSPRGSPLVSVVVPTVDRVALLQRCLRGLAAQQGVTYEVLVVHDGHPEVVSLLDAWAGRLPLHPVPVAERGASAKRNAGWRAAAADLVAFTDDDCEPAPGWLAALVAAFADPAVDLVQGRVDPHPEDAAVSGPYARTIEVTGPLATYPNANLGYRRAALQRVRGFDERFAAGEDTDLAWRVLESGGQVVYADEARVWHAVRDVTLRGHLRSLPRWASLAAVVKRHPQLRSLAHRRVFWKRTHPLAWLALLGVAGAAATPRRPVALALAVPHVVRRRPLGLAVADCAECLVMLAGSLRHRSVLL